LPQFFKKAKGDNRLRREQFTFYRSYYEAMKDLSVEECAKLLLAIAAYALDEEEPELSGSCSACFKLIRPTLDSGRNKAANRMNAEEQTEIKPKSNGNKAKSNQNKLEQTEIKSEQTGTNRKEREKESEKESEKEKEREYDSSSTPVPPLTDDELRRLRQEQQDVETAAKRVGLPVSAMSDYDTMDNLRAEHGADNLLKAIDRIQGAAEKCRSWRYVGGILRKEKNAGYTWAERAAESGGGTAGDAEVITRNPFALQSLKCRGSVT
jgi:hypothetical protein